MYLITNIASSEEYNPYEWFVLEITQEFKVLLQHANDIVSIAAKLKNFLSVSFKYGSAWFTTQENLDEDLDIELAKGVWLSKGIEWKSNQNCETEQADYFTLSNEDIQFVLNPAHTDNLKIYSMNINLAELMKWSGC